MNEDPIKSNLERSQKPSNAASAFALDKAWAQSAIEKISANIDTLCSQEFPPTLEKPNNPVRMELLKLASVCKGVGHSEKQAWDSVAFAFRKHPASVKRIRYQISRAFKVAQPRKRGELL